MSDKLTQPTGRLERRFLHVLQTSGSAAQHRANVMVGRATRTVRRGSLVLAVGWLGLVCLAAAWVMFNLAMHGWATSRWSAVTAHFVVMGINVLGGALLLILAAVLAPRVTRKPRRPARSPEEQPLLAAQAEPGPPPDSIEGALGSAIELGLLASQTIPQIIRAFRKPKPESQE